MVPLGFIGAGILLVVVIFQYIFFSATLQSLEQDAPKMNCERLLHSDLYGPEDMTMSLLHDVMFISSHNRRDFATEGAILMLKTDSNEIIKLPAVYPDKFHPHGLALFEDKTSDTSRLFVISHLMSTIHDDGNHSIEVFDFDYNSNSLRHVESLQHPFIVHPNDLLALSKHELLISNDHGEGTKLAGMLDDVLHTPRSDLVYYNGKNSVERQFMVVKVPPIEFGNGIIAFPSTDTGEDGTVTASLTLYRASCTEFALHKYRLNRYISNKNGDVGLDMHEIELIPLPIAPDNLEYDPLTGGILIAGHPSTWAFMTHAVLQQRSPSSVMLYDVSKERISAKTDVTTDTTLKNATAPNLNPSATSLYYSSGVEISASSVAVRGQGGALYIGQVFDPFILYCKPID